MAQDEWFSDFFSTAWPKIQSGGYGAERTSVECDHIARFLQLQPGARVLDLPCGIGRHSIELSRRGFQVTGADFSPEFVEMARTEAKKADVQPTFGVSDMREFRAETPFDAAFCYFGSFGYFRNDGDSQHLRAVARALRPGARFLLDVHLMETLLPIFRERDWFWADAPLNSRRILEERSFDLSTGRVESTWTVVDDAGAASSRSSIRIYTFAELRGLLEANGFQEVVGYDGKTGDALTVGSRRAAIVATRGHA